MNEDNQDPAQEEEWLRQLNVIYAALIAIGVYMVRPLLTAAWLDLSAKICVRVLGRHPTPGCPRVGQPAGAFRRRLTKSRSVAITRAVAQTLAFIGLVAGFWHTWRVAGVSILTSAIVGVAVHSAGYVHLEHDAGPESQGAEEPDEPAS